MSLYAQNTKQNKTTQFFFQGGSTSNTTTTTTTTTTATATTATATTTTSSGGSSNTIRIEQNGGVNSWWYAVEFPDDDISRVISIEFQDSSHDSWVNGTLLSWDAYEFAHGGVQFSGSQDFRITTSGGTQENYDVFSGISANSIATLNVY